MTRTKANKQQIIQIITEDLTKKLMLAVNAANEAHAAAVDDQSVAETQYDTLAIEASYLAEGQSRRVDEYQQAINAYQNLQCIDFNQSSQIALTALIQLSADSDKDHWFFIGPAAGGLCFKYNKQSITVITPQSPMGMALIGKQQDDDIEVIIGSKKLEDYISQTF